MSNKKPSGFAFRRVTKEAAGRIDESLARAATIEVYAGWAPPLLAAVGALRIGIPGLFAAVGHAFP